jgi:hypothetical protein
MTLPDMNRTTFRLNDKAFLQLPNNEYALLWEIDEETGPDEYLRRVFMVTTCVEEMALLRQLIKANDPLINKVLNDLLDQMKTTKGMKGPGASLHYDRLQKTPYLKLSYFRQMLSP